MNEDILDFEHFTKNCGVRFNAKHKTQFKCERSERFFNKLMAEILPPGQSVENADEYKQWFNEEVKLVNDMSDDEIFDRIKSLEKIERNTKARLQASKSSLEQRKLKMTEKERERLRERDKEYSKQNKWKEKEEVKQPRKSAASKSKEEKAYDALKAAGIGDEQARKLSNWNG